MLLGLLCFYHLNYGVLSDWDEARHGVSAYEMLRNGEPVVSTWQYEPDYWNLKPPLSEWFIMLGYRIFAFNAWGLRFYSALSIFLTGLLCAVSALFPAGCWAAARFAYEQAHFYIANQDNNSWNGSGWTQAQVMEAEWLADCAPRSGGISAFAEDPGSYLIASNARTEDFSAYELICRSEAYSLYHHKTRN